MSRRGGTPKRIVTPDPIYKSTVVTKLINQIMLDGKRGTAQRIYQADWRARRGRKIIP